MFISKQDLKSVPFQVLYEKVTLAGRNAIANLSKNEEAAYERMLARKEREYLDTHEAPDEGELRERYPYTGPSAEDKAEERAKAVAEETKEQITKLGLKAKGSWLLPQITAHIAKMSLPRNAEGKIDPLKFLSDNFTDDWHKGLYHYCMAYQRGLIVGQQYTLPFRNYSALVPLLMMPAKKFNGVQYSEWDKEKLKLVVDSQLYKAMTCDIPRGTLSTEEILENRRHGLEIKSGKNVGTSRNPATSFKLYGTATETFSQLPWLVQVMAAQIWVAHPTNRTDVMVLDWENWDNMPASLIVTEILPSTPKKTTLVGANTHEVPWWEEV